MSKGLRRERQAGYRQDQRRGGEIDLPFLQGEQLTGQALRIAQAASDLAMMSFTTSSPISTFSWPAIQRIRSPSARPGYGRSRSAGTGSKWLRDLVQLGRNQDEDRIGRRLLQGLQERIQALVESMWASSRI